MPPPFEVILERILPDAAIFEGRADPATFGIRGGRDWYSPHRPGTALETWTRGETSHFPNRAASSNVARRQRDGSPFVTQRAPPAVVVCRSQRRGVESVLRV